MSFSLTSRQHGQHLTAITCDPIKLLPPSQQYGRKSTIEKPVLMCFYIVLNSIGELISPADMPQSILFTEQMPSSIWVFPGLVGFGKSPILHRKPLGCTKFHGEQMLSVLLRLLSNNCVVYFFHCIVFCKCKNA